MNKRTVGMYVIAALVAGVVLGSFGIATAAPSKAASGTAGAGLKLGASVQAAKATLADVVAKLTGKSVTEVRAARGEGKSFAQIASASGVASSKVVADTLAARKTLLASLVAQGKITQAQADAALARMAARLNQRVSTTAACTGSGGGCGTGAGAGAGGGCGMGGGGAGGCGGCASAPTQ
jgi:hypothetical protein